MKLNILQRYILRNILFHLFFIVSILVVLFLSIAYFHFVQEAAAAKLTTGDIAKLIVTEIPVLLQPIIPLSFFLAILMAFRNFYAAREVMGMYASGHSSFNLLMPIFIFGVLLSVLTTVMELEIFPLANAARIHILEDSMHKVSVQKLFPKQFNQIRNGQVIYIDKKIENRNQLQGIFYSATLPDKENDLAYDIIVAKYLEEMTAPDRNRFVVFVDGKRYTSKLTNGESTIIKFKKLALRVSNFDYRLENWPGCLKIKQLFAMAKYDRYAAAELHWRLSIPISVVNLTLFAIAFNRNRIIGYTKIMSYLYPLIVYLLYINLLLTGMGLIKTGVIGKHVGLWFVHALMLMLCAVTLRYKPE